MAVGYVWSRSACTWRSALCFPLLPVMKLNGNPLQGNRTMLLVQARQLSKVNKQQVPPKQTVKLMNDKLSPYPYIIPEQMENFITGGDPQAKMKLQAVLLLMAFMRERGEKLPEILDSQNFLEMIECSEHEVYKLIEMYNFHSNKNTLSVKIKNDKKLKRNSVNHKESSLANAMNNSLLFPISKIDQSHYYNTNLIQGLLFGQQIVFDCAFDDYMTLIEIKTTAKHLNDCIRHNRRSLRPFGLNFCNVESNGKLLRHLKLHNPSIENDLPVNLYTSSYLDVFRKEDIVYLSPFVHREFEYHPHDVYVLSALSNNNPLCVKKARKEGVRCFKLPLGFYEMKRRSRLSINEAFKKLLLKKDTDT
ncbi:tRNA methyltransferase 10 homolog C-like isoform X2 [Thrips palmi]|uniref:tRNA methyltransferase 10 homolog C-like isoform X2 n=1 Tax=Thrips palmi TaxID=161013 RepID=A0A6P8Z947_THRPL|nr:tRNA methyltransferase 10 homolog C-like isoform X2 [Thrips palmi]